MKKSVLILLLSAFTFIIVHDYVISAMDDDTQTELVLYESGQLQSEAMCQASKVHNHLHESLIGCEIDAQSFISQKAIKTVVISYISPIIPQDTSTRLYRPPIV